VRQLDAAGRIQNLLATRGLRCLPLKGAALVERLYDSVAHRPMGDIDLLVLDDWPTAVALIEAAGFVERGRADHAWTFREAKSGVTVELHHGVTSCARVFPLAPEDTWSRSRSGCGLVRQIPSSEDLLVHLSLHAAFQHGLALSLVQYLDFRRLLEREPPDLALLTKIATQAGAKGAVALALEAAHVVVGAPLNPALGDLVVEWLPRALRRYVVTKVRLNPFALLAPTEPPLARLRWALATGRRLTLIRETLTPSHSSLPRPTRLTGLGRALGLARRWSVPTIRSIGIRPHR